MEKLGLLGFMVERGLINDYAASAINDYDGPIS